MSIRQNHLNDPDVPIKLNTEEDTRFYHCNIKTLNLLPSVAAVQVSADGQPIVMLADHQTTGGYAKIATVISADSKEKLHPMRKLTKSDRSSK